MLVLFLTTIILRRERESVCMCVCVLRKVVQMESSLNICMSENVFLWSSHLNDLLSIEFRGIGYPI